MRFLFSFCSCVVHGHNYVFFKLSVGHWGNELNVMNKKISRRSRGKTKAPLFVLLAMIFVVIGVIATIFSFFVIDDTKNKDTLNVGASSDKGSSMVSTPSSENLSSKDTSSAKTVSSANTSSGSETPKIATKVAESEAVDKTYFDNAVFIGDSISKGLKLYGVIPPQNVLADQNVGLDQIAGDKEVYQTADGTKKTLFNSLSALSFKPEKIYVMLGSNGLPHYANDKHIAYYEKVVDRLIKTYPGKTIYLQSVTPITKDAEERYKKNGKDFTNKKINEFNKMILNLAEKKGVKYLSVRDVLVDKNGYLSAEYDGSDGVHFKKSGHEAMYKYYKTHTVAVAKTDDTVSAASDKPIE